MSRHSRKRGAGGVFGALLGWIVYILIIVGLTYLIITFVGQRTRVSGSSMETTLSHGDNLIVDKISYRFQDPKRYDIIVFPYKHEENTYYINRIVGLPGETVQVIDGYTYINGELLEGDVYGTEVMESSGIAGEPVVLGEDEYFVLGDNRASSEDSRNADVANVKREYIYGKAWFVISPRKDFGWVK